MNQGRDGAPISGFGEEYTPIEFAKRELTGVTKLAHQIIFGQNPDRLFLNFRARQLMQLLHAGELAQDVLVTDPRVTYLPFKSDLFEQAFRTKLLTAVTYPVYIVGTHQANEAQGRCTQQWQITLASTEINVAHRTQDDTYTSEPGEPVKLPGSELTLSAPQAPNGTVLRVESNGRPTLNTAALLRMTTQLLGQRGMDELFVGQTEPMKTWRTIWNRDDSASRRFSAFLMALAYRIEQSPHKAS